MPLARQLRHPLAAALAVCAVVAMAALSAGCRLPAIDPTGERIFSGESTQFQLPSCPLVSGAPAVPAVPIATPVPVATPVPKPPCQPPVVAVPVVIATPVAPPVAAAPPPQICQPVSSRPAARYPELKITPSRIVAPVCSEVIVAAGLCGTDGHFIMRQPIEWMLAQDGAGQIVQVGKESLPYASYLLRGSPDKVATNYARAHTSTISQTIGRGTATRADDVTLEKGQSWISVSSPTEGTSHVTCWAPNECNWPNRKRTATIYWVDARWTFPPCTTLRAGQKHLLTTTVTRTSGVPVGGWIVRYEVLDGPNASFANDARAVDVRTDHTGAARIELLSKELTPGITRVSVQIIRPESGPGDPPQMIVGQSVTSVCWTTPGLQVLAVGPASVLAGGTINYQVQVLNNGDLPNRGVSLSFAPPPGVTFLNSNPAAQPFGTTLKWQIGDLPARATASYSINCRADRDADLASTFVATSADGLRAQGDVRTRVVAPSLRVTMNGPDAVEVGQRAKFLIEVVNAGSAPIGNVTVSDNFDPGLAHVDSSSSPIVNSLGSLAPGEARRFAVTFIVVQPGRQCHRLDVTGDGNQTVSARGCVTGLSSSQPVPTPPVVRPPSAIQPSADPPQLAVRVRGPAQKRVDEIAAYFIDVANTGGAAATNVRIEVEFGVNLQPKDATRGSSSEPGRRMLTWQVARIEAGATETRQINALCLNPDERATMRATVTARETAAQSAEAETQIAPASGGPVDPGAARPPRSSPATPPAAAALPGQLRLSVAPLSNPILMGRNTSFQIVLLNDRDVADRDVALTIHLPDGLQFAKMSSPNPEPGFRAGDRTLQLTPVNTLRPGEELRYTLEVTGARAGRQAVEVLAQSAGSPTAVSKISEVTVNAAQ